MPPTRGSAGRVIAPVWRCTGWGLPSRHVSVPLVRSYRTFSPLPSTLAGRFGGVLSVALSVGFPRLGVTQHPALRCPDFPRASRCRDARGCLARADQDSYLQGAAGCRAPHERQRPRVAAPARSRASRAARLPGAPAVASNPPSRALQLAERRARLPTATATPAAVRPRSASPVEFETVEVPAAPAQPAPGSRRTSSQRTAPRTAGSLRGAPAARSAISASPVVSASSLPPPVSDEAVAPLPAQTPQRGQRGARHGLVRTGERLDRERVVEDRRAVHAVAVARTDPRARDRRPRSSGDRRPAATAASAAFAAGPGPRAPSGTSARSRARCDPGATPAATSASTVSASTPQVAARVLRGQEQRAASTRRPIDGRRGRREERGRRKLRLRSRSDGEGRLRLERRLDVARSVGRARERAPAAGRERPGERHVPEGPSRRAGSQIGLEHEVAAASVPFALRKRQSVPTRRARA